jgi:hypothetical protein
MKKGSKKITDETGRAKFVSPNTFDAMKAGGAKKAGGVKKKGKKNRKARILEALRRQIFQHEGEENGAEENGAIDAAIEALGGVEV